MGCPKTTPTGVTCIPLVSIKVKISAMANRQFHGKRNTGGRPRKEEWVKLKYRLPAVKVNTEEFFAIKEKAKAAGVTLTEFIRQSVLSGGVIEKVTPEQMKLIRDLAGMGNNVNQLARQANAAGYRSDAERFSALGVELMNIIYKFKDSKDVP